MGTSGEMMLTPFGALAAGFLAGALSTLGYQFLTVGMPLQPRVEWGFSGLLPSPTGPGWEGLTKLTTGVLSFSLCWSPNSKCKTRVGSITFTGCLGSWGPCWVSS